MRLREQTAQARRGFDELAVIDQHGELQEAHPVVEGAIPSWVFFARGAQGTR